MKWKRSLGLGLWCTALLVGGCSHEDIDISIYFPTYDPVPESPLPPIAVGARVSVAFHGGYFYYEGCAEPYTVQVETLTVDPEGHLSWEPRDDPFSSMHRLHALSAGLTTLTISGTVEGVDARGKVTVETRVAEEARYRLQNILYDRAIDLDYDLTCAPGQPLVGRPGTVLRGVFQDLLDAEGLILAGEGLLPLWVGSGQLEIDPLLEPYRGHQLLAITLPSTEGTVSLVPPVGTGGLTIEVTDASTITGIAAAPRMQTWGEAGVRLWTELDGAADCFWTGIPIVGTVETPNECIFGGGDPATLTIQAYDDPIRVFPLPSAVTKQCTLRFVTQIGEPVGEHETVVTFSTDP